MLRSRTLSIFAATLLLFAGMANAERRYFEFTGTVTRSENPGIAPVGSTIRGTFNYDDAMSGDYLQDSYAFYELDDTLDGTVNGHALLSDRTFVTIYDYPDSAGDLFDIYTAPGIMIDDAFHPEGFFGFRLLGSGLQSRNLPSAFDLSQFNYAAGEVMLDGNSTVLAEFSVDGIRACVKKNGKPDKHCKNKN